MEKALAAWLLVTVSVASLMSPREVVQTAVDQVVRVVQDSDLARPSTIERRRLEIRGIAERLFDFPEMARRSLARHWSARSAEQREEFVGLYRELLERLYFGRLENYSGERIAYTGETVDGRFATVRSKIIGDRNGEIPIDYRLHLVGSRWAVYDLLIDGISIVSSYRAQFDRIIETSSYDDLIRKMRLKRPKNTTAEPSSRQTD